jgi:O-antigen/teichoic acid export membrane protein
MKTNIRKLGKDGLIYGLGIAISRAASFVMLPIYTRYLTPADYGAAELLTTTIDVIAMIVGLGITGAIFKCYADAGTDDDKKKVISTSLIILLALTLITSLVGIVFSGPISGLVFSDRNFTKYFQLMFITFFIQQGITSIPLMYIRAIGRPQLFVMIGVVKLLVHIALNLYFLVVLKYGLKGVLLSSLIGETVIGTYLLAYSFRHIGFRYSRIVADELIRLGYPFIVTSLSSFILVYSDRYFLKAFNDLDTIGIYALAYKFGFMLSALVVVPFQSAWEPQRYNIAKQEDGKGIFARVFLYLNVVIVSVSLMICLSVGDILKIIASSPYWPASALVPFMLINAVLQSWTIFCDYGLYHARKTGRIATSSVISAALVIALNFVLIPAWGVYGAIFATFCAFIVRLSLRYVWSQRYYTIDYGWGKISGLLLLAAMAYFFRFSVDIHNIVVALAVDSLLFLAYVLIAYYAILDRSERDNIQSFLKEKFAASKKASTDII